MRTWHVMVGNLPSDDGNNADAKACGHYLEAGCLAWWLDQKPNRSIIGTQVTSTLGIGPPPPWTAHAYDGDDLVLVDAKTAATDDHWTDTEPPAYYVASSLWQLACCPDASRVHLAVLFGRLRLSFREYVIERDDALIAGLIDECRTFYDTVQAGQEPGLSDMACDYDVIRTVHPDIDRDGVAVLPDDLVTDFLTDAATSARTRHQGRHPRRDGHMPGLAKDSSSRTSPAANSGRRRDPRPRRAPDRPSPKARPQHEHHDPRRDCASACQLLPPESVGSCPSPRAAPARKREQARPGVQLSRVSRRALSATVHLTMSATPSSTDCWSSTRCGRDPSLSDRTGCPRSTARTTLDRSSTA